MADLAYSPNRAARALVTSRSRTLGILASSSEQYGPASSIAAIEAAARTRGYWVTTANIDGSSADSIPEVLAHLLAQSIEGLVVIAPEVRVLRALQSHEIGIPWVTLQSADLEPDHTLSVDQIEGRGSRRDTSSISVIATSTTSPVPRTGSRRRRGCEGS